MFKKKFFVVLFLIMIISASAIYAFDLEKHSKYTLYIGLNDKDSGTQKVNTEEAKKLFFEIASKYSDGYTLYEADGFWREGEMMASEHTFVCVFIDVSQEAVKNIMDETIVAFNQSSILVEYEETNSFFYR